MAHAAHTEAAEPCWVITGPTGSGKTAAALQIARRHAVEIVSVDSMQVYRGMDIGTAKPSPEQLALVPHHMIDVLDPSEPCNVSWFCCMALRAIEDIAGRGRRPLLVGGSPLYLKGLIWGLMEAPAKDERLRGELRREAERHGSAHLHRRLAQLDPAAAQRIHPNDVQRLVRALEVCRLTGQTLSGAQQQFCGPARLPHVMAGVRHARTALYARIDRRVDRMMERGLLAEVQSLRGRLGPQAQQALGYKELMGYLDGRHALEEAVRLIKRNTRRYAKHQLTWFRHFPQVRWADAHGCEGPSELADRCEPLLARSA